MAAGLVLVYNIPKLNTDGTVAREHFGGSSFPLSKLGLDTKSAIYAGFLALLVNLIVTAVVTLILRAMKVHDGVDGTSETDYTAEREDPTVRDLPDPLASTPPGLDGTVRGRT
jgi:SSS family solute:Na+ symporter